MPDSHLQALEQHLLLAAAEAPFDSSSTAVASTAGRLERRVSLFGSGAWGLIQGLVDRGQVQKVPTAGGWLLSASKTLARQRSMSMSIRAIDEKSVTVLRESDKRLIDELPYSWRGPHSSSCSQPHATPSHARLKYTVPWFASVVSPC